MPYSEKLAARVRERITQTHKISEEKEIFKGLCFMVDDKMCVAVHTDEIMIRINPALDETVREMPGCKPMKMKEKILKGYYYVSDDVLKTKKQLEYWVNLAPEFNKIAKASKKKIKKKTATVTTAKKK
ncbi:MAG: TfoX/Sxy family protein [Chitinophagaceae bacterium]|nr:TfoX/Sxy family protein [Chitinophagaceae bacterium]